MREVGGLQVPVGASMACSVHAQPERTKTSPHRAMLPCASAADMATTMVSPLMATCPENRLGISSVGVSP